MASKKVILTDKAPKPRPVLSQAIVHNDMIYCSGSLGMDPVTEKMVEGTVEARTVGPSLFYFEIIYLRLSPSIKMH